MKWGQNEKKGFDQNYRQEALSITIDSNIKLPEELEELKLKLSDQEKSWLTGEVIVNGIGYPAVFMPFTKYVEGKLKMYSEVALLPDSEIELTQNLVNRISKKVCRKIKNRAKLTKRLGKKIGDSRRKKLDPNWGKGLARKKPTRSDNFEEELEIQVIEDIPQRIENMMPEISPDVIGSLYLEVNQGIIRGILRFDVYEIWIHPDFYIETKNEMLSMIWRKDEQEDEAMLQNWFNNNEKNLGTLELTNGVNYTIKSRFRD